MRAASVAILILAASACGRHESKTAEVRSNIKRIYDAARAYYMEAQHSPDGRPRFPASVGPTPPPGSCCQGGKDLCAPDPSLWTDPTWVQLGFSMKKPHRYSYQYIRRDDGRGYTVRGLGDLDCDGAYSTFEMYATVNE